jgi:hypothetical protein
MTNDPHTNGPHTPANPAANPAADPRSARSARRTSPSINRAVAGTLGLIFLLLGALSFTALGDPNLYGDGGNLLFGAFQVSGLLIAFRIIAGLVLLLATRDTVLGSARTNISVGVVTLLIAVAAPFIDSAVDTEILALTTADYVLFALGSVALIAAGVFFDREHTSADTPPAPPRL